MTEQRIGRNDSCPCGSGTKFKRCHGAPEGAARVPEVRHYIDTGESPVRWVISNDSGTAFFADKQGRVMVFADKSIALEIAQLDMFASQEPNEINVAGVGPTKWQHLQESLPFLEVSSAEMAIALIQERISAKTAGEEVAESVPEINQELALDNLEKVIAIAAAQTDDIEISEAEAQALDEKAPRNKPTVRAKPLPKRTR
jgi:hypothetical protein